MKSELSGFYRLSLAERRAVLAEQIGLTPADVDRLAGRGGLDECAADRMIENALGLLQLPLGVCVNLRVDGVDRIVPMAIEEPSVIAAASHAAKLLRATGGVRTEATRADMIGQIQVLDVPEPGRATEAVLAARSALLERANRGHDRLAGAGGGAHDLEVRRLAPSGADDPLGEMLIVHLVVDVRDAMGANAVNSMCEAIAPDVARLTGGRVRLRILSNLTDRRRVTAVGRVPVAALRPRAGGAPRHIAEGIVEASVFAERDPYRAATHNKGIMNGVDAVLVAFGQDWRAVEAGAHAWAARDGRYGALARWRVVPGPDGDDALEGRLDLPLAVGTVGGAVTSHPTVRTALRLAGVRGAADLARLAAAVGLAQNLGALRALADEGIQRGHMRLHARKGAAPEPARDTPVAAAGALADDASPTAIRRRFERARGAHLDAVVAAIEAVAAESTPPDSRLRGMLDYQLATGGKRLRAALPLLVAESLGVDAARLVPFAAACELLHNATLVHDDLQDGDTLRRGQPTVWSRYGAPSAIDLGDAMLYWTVQLLDRVEAAPEARAAATRRLLGETIRVIDGQEREFALKDHERPSLDAYFRMVEGKTSGLFVLPLAGAAALAGAPDALVEGLAEAGRHMGVLFQIQDDLLDLYGDKGRHGRGSDIAEGKRSVLVVHALERGASAEAARLRAILGRSRDETTPADIAEAQAIFERTGALDRAVAEIGRRAHAAAEQPALAAHPALAALVRGTCALFLDPLRDLLDARADAGAADPPSRGAAPV